MAGVEVATLFVSVVAETSKLAPSIRRGLASADADGRKAGQQLGDGLSSGAQKGVKGVSGAVDSELQKSGKTAEATGKGIGGRFGAGFKSAAGMISAFLGTKIVAGGIKFLGDSVKAASDLAESGNKVEQVFGKATPAIVAYADKSAKALGMSTIAARDATSQFGIFGKAAGLSGKPLSDFSAGLTTLAGDLASFSNTSPEEAVVALTAALRGESEPMRAYGVLLDDATLKSRALSMGLIKGSVDEAKIAVIRIRAQEQLKKYNEVVKQSGAGSLEAQKAQAALGATQAALSKAVTGTVQPLTQQQRVLAAQAEVMAQTKVQQGDFARTSDGLANSQRILSAQFENVKAKIGSALLPAVTGIVTFLNDKAFPAFEGIGSAAAKLGPAFGAIGSVLSTLSPLIITFASGWAAYQAVAIASTAATYAGVLALELQTLWTGRAAIAQRGMAIAQGLLNAAMALNPIGLVVAALVALGVGLTLAYQKSETFRNIVNAVWNGVKAVALTVVSWFTGSALPAITLFLTSIGRQFSGLLQVSTTVWNGIRTVIATVVGWLNAVARPIIGAYVAYVTGVFNTLRAVATVVWNAIQAVINTVLSWFRGVAQPAFAAVLAFLTARFVAARAAVEVVWNAIRAVINAVLAWFRGTAQPAFAAVLAFLQAAFNTARTVIVAAWNTIRAGINAVVNWFRGTAGPLFAAGLAFVTGRFEAFKSNMQAGWNFIKGIVNSTVGWITGTGLPTLTRGFQTAVSAIDKAWDALKEVVAKPVRWVVDNVINKFIDTFNNISSKVSGPTLPRASLNVGGPVAPTTKWTPGLTRNRGGVIPGAYPGPGRDNTWGLIGGHTPVQLAGQEWIIQGSTARGYGPAIMRDFNAGRIPRWLLESYSQGQIPGLAGGGPTYQQQAAWLRGSMPWARVTSGYRPGSITSSGNRSFHASGNAVDVAPSGMHTLMEVFNRIYAAFARTAAELIYTPAGGRQVKNGNPLAFWGASVARDHYDHVHWAMRSMLGGAPTDGGLSGLVGSVLGGLIGPARSLITGLIDKMPGSGTIVGFVKNAATKLVEAGFAKLTSLDQPIYDGIADRAIGPAPKGGSVQAAVQAVAAKFGWGSGAQWNALSWIIQHESGWNPQARNPSSGAYGLPQALPGNKMAEAGPNWRTDPSTQALWMMQYIGTRYKTPLGAQAFWKKHNWYNEGGPVAEAIDAGADVMKYDAGGMLRYGDVGLHLRKTPDAVLTSGQWADVRKYLPGQDGPAGIGRNGANITINGIKYDAVGEFANELNYALTRAEARSRY